MRIFWHFHHKQKRFHEVLAASFVFLSLPLSSATTGHSSGSRNLHYFTATVCINIQSSRPPKPVWDVALWWRALIMPPGCVSCCLHTHPDTMRHAAVFPYGPVTCLRPPPLFIWVVSGFFSYFFFRISFSKFVLFFFRFQQNFPSVRLPLNHPILLHAVMTTGRKQ